MKLNGVSYFHIQTAVYVTQSGLFGERLWRGREREVLFDWEVIYDEPL